MAPHVASVRIRWSDLDPLGHVNNVRMLELVQEARVQMLDGLGIFEQHGHEGSGNPGHAESGGRSLAQVVAKLEISYLRPLLLGGDATVLTSLRTLGTSSYTLAFQIQSAEGHEVAQGSTVLVVIDPASGKPQPIPDGMVQALKGFTEG